MFLQLCLVNDLPATFQLPVQASSVLFRLGGWAGWRVGGRAGGRAALLI